MPKKKLTTFMTVRVTPTLRHRFRKKAEKHGDSSTVHREILEAFVDGRLTIKPNPKKESLYQ